MSVPGIVVATDIEAKGIKELMSGLKTRELGKNRFFEGFIQDQKIIMVVSGIGKVNACIYTKEMIATYNPDLILNIGTAGAISEGVTVGDTVVCERVFYHDFDHGLLMRFHPRFCDRYFKTQQEYSKAFLQKLICQYKEGAVIMGTIASGDRFVNSKLNHKIPDSVTCVDMESAAIAHTCALYDVPFTAIKLISDQANEKAADSFKEFRKTVLQRTKKIMEILFSGGI